MKLPFFVFLSVCLIVLGTVRAEEKREPIKQTLIVLDASGSMWGQIQGEAKIEIARKVIGDLVTKLPEDTEIGLVAYGHRAKGDCEDIELVVPPGKLNKEDFLKKVNGLMPKGMTPLTAAVEFAAKTLAHSEQKATVILVTDGEETCDRDPCEAARTLKETGVDFTAHVIAFDLDSKAAQSVECMAKETDGLFLKADDAASLSDALQITLESVKEVEEEKKEEPPAAELKGPKEVVAGAEFKVEWTGGDEKADYITIVMEGAEDEAYGNYAYTRSGSPAKLTALMTVGAAELRYIHGDSKKILAKQPIQIVEAEVSVKGPEETVAGGAVKIEWTGPDNKGDYVTVVPKDLEDGKYAQYEYTSNGSPLKVTAPMTAGDGEIRYMAGQGNKVLARAPIKIVEAEVSVKGPEETVAGGAVKIEWTGPDNKGDYVTVVPKDLEDGKYAQYEYTSNGSPLKVTAPMTAGDGEIRYMAGQGNKVLARAPIQIVEAEVSVKGPEQTVAGAAVKIEWTGPDNKGDYVTVVMKELEDGKYAKYEYTSNGSPLKVTVPMTAGDGEIRYMAGQGNKVLARAPIKIVEAEVSVKGPEEVVAGATVKVEWTGPDNQGDFVTIVPKDLEDGKYAKYEYTSNGSPLKILAPMTAGEGEIRYMSGQGNQVLARVPIKIVEAKIALTRPEEAAAGSMVTVEWEGPNNKDDYITVVPKDMEDGEYAEYEYTRNGSPLKVKAPSAAGDGEIRYMSGQGNKVLGRTAVKITPAEE